MYYLKNLTLTKINLQFFNIDIKWNSFLNL